MKLAHWLFAQAKYLGLFRYCPGHCQTPAGLRAFIDMLRAMPIT
jgi:hypothetical protein